MINELKLGLGNPPYPIYLYVKNEEMGGEQYVWYKYIINQKEKIPVYERAITGYVSELRLTEKDYNGQDNLKLDIILCADELYVIRSGINTNFAKSFLLAASLVEDFSKALTIVANPGNESVVFCSLYDAASKTKIRRDWDANADSAGIIQSIQSKLSSNQKYEFDEEDSIAVVKPQTPYKGTSKLAPPHPQDIRVKKIRVLLNYPVELVKEWLHFQDAKAPSELSESSIDQTIRNSQFAMTLADSLPLR